MKKYAIRVVHKLRISEPQHQTHAALAYYVSKTFSKPPAYFEAALLSFSNHLPSL